MDVQLRRILPLWFDIPIGLLSAGIYPLLLLLAHWNRVRRLDEAGIVVHLGKRIGWREITSVTYGTDERRGLRMSKQLAFATPCQTAILPIWRASNAVQLTDYCIAHLPPGAWQVPETGAQRTGP